MAATKYQVLYRYINESTNTPITNDMSNEYQEVCEFYTDPAHKIFSTDATVKAEAMREQQEMISFGNSSDNPKTNMLFAYNGTKKINHKKWVNAQIGYVVRDWSGIRDKIGNQGDFSKEFTTLNAATPEDGGIVVCTYDVMKKYFDDTLTLTVSTGGNYTTDSMLSEIINSTIFQLQETTNILPYMSPSNTGVAYGYYTSSGYTYYTGPIAVDVVIGSFRAYSRWGTSPITFAGNTDSRGLYSKATIKHTQLQTVTIPGHYEEATTAPYLIKDTYKRIQLSPWFVNATYGSLEAALERAKTLVDMIGINNVKLIKLVPFDQFVKIK